MLLKCARDIYDERKRRCDRKKRCLPKEIWLLRASKKQSCFYHGKPSTKTSVNSNTVNSSSFWEQQKKKVKICGYMDEATF